VNINLQIERLVLEGVTLPPGGERILRTALEAELTRLLRAGGVAPGLRSGGAVPSVAAPPISADGDPATLGRSVAQSVYGGMV
jgi:hypothetical protein